MGTILISNEKQTGNYTYESDVYKVTGSCKYNLETKEFDSADGAIFKDDVNVGYFNSYTEINSNEVKTNLTNIRPDLLPELSTVVIECLTSIGEYYK